MIERYAAQLFGQFRAIEMTRYGCGGGIGICCIAQLSNFHWLLCGGNSEHQRSGAKFGSIATRWYAKYLELIGRQAHVSPKVLATTKTYCDRRGNLDGVSIGAQVQFWESTGRLDKRILAADLIDFSFIGNENAAAQSLPR